MQASEGAPFVTECKEQRLHVERASGGFELFDKDSQTKFWAQVYHPWQHAYPLPYWRCYDQGRLPVKIVPWHGVTLHKTKYRAVSSTILILLTRKN
jgi:hypothetical protein